MKTKLSKLNYAPYLILFGVILVPLLYSYFYLGAFWDPYSKLDNVPVAIVNEDSGAMINGKSRNLGNELCDELKKEKALDFIFTDAKTAQDGLKKTDYYAVLTIPSDFSGKIASSTEDQKQAATITYCSNEKRNYLASQILNTAFAKVETSLRTSVTEEIVSTLSDKLQEVPTQLETLNDGLTKIHNGATDLTSGTSDLVNGATTLHSGAAQLAAGTNALKDGAATLANGTSSLKTGSSQLLTGSNTLASGLTTFQSKLSQYLTGVESAKTGSVTLASGLTSLNSGIDKLLSGAQTLESSTAKITDLKDGASALAAGATSLESGITSYTQGVSSLITNVTKTTQALAQYAAATKDPTISAIVAQLTSKENLAGLQALQNATSNLTAGASGIKNGASALSAGTQNLPQLKAAISMLRAGLETAKSGATKLSDGSTSLSNGLDQLAQANTALTDATSKLTDGAGSLNTGMGTLYSGINKVNSGASTLSDATKKVNDGAASLEEGTNSLLSGSSTLNDGATQLTDGIKTANDKVSSSLTDANSQMDSLKGLDSFAGSSVTLEKESYAAVPNYGTAFAPYFMSLSLWVGGLMIFFGIYFDPDRKFKVLSRHSEHVVKRSIAYLVIGLLQAVALAFVLILALNLHVTNLPLYFASCCLVSLVFIAIIQLFLLFFSNIGKFLAIALLILQLTSCGGTFPMETVPNLYNMLYKFMPMTYSVGLFKEAISGTGDSSLIMFNTVVLVGLLAGTLALTAIFTVLKNRRKSDNNVELTY